MISEECSLQVRKVSHWTIRYSFLSLMNDPRWDTIENAQIEKFEAVNGAIENETFARDLFRMIINHSDRATRQRYFPMLEEALQKGETQSLRYAKMKDRLPVEQKKYLSLQFLCQLPDLTDRPPVAISHRCTKQPFAVGSQL